MLVGVGVLFVRSVVFGGVLVGFAVGQVPVVDQVLHVLDDLGPPREQGQREQRDEQAALEDPRQHMETIARVPEPERSTTFSTY